MTFHTIEFIISQVTQYRSHATTLTVLTPLKSVMVSTIVETLVMKGFCVVGRRRMDVVGLILDIQVYANSYTFYRMLRGISIEPNDYLSSKVDNVLSVKV